MAGSNNRRKKLLVLPEQLYTTMQFLFDSTSTVSLQKFNGIRTKGTDTLLTFDRKFDWKHIVILALHPAH